jgi:hypothetical protein
MKLTIRNTTQPNKQVSAATMHYANESLTDNTDKNNDNNNDDDANIGTQTLTSINNT